VGEGRRETGDGRGETLAEPGPLRARLRWTSFIVAAAGVQGARSPLAIFRYWERRRAARGLTCFFLCFTFFISGNILEIPCIYRHTKMLVG
jgi:hypothetical protein